MSNSLIKQETITQMHNKGEIFYQEIWIFRINVYNNHRFSSDNSLTKVILKFPMSCDNEIKIVTKKLQYQLW